MPNRQRNPGEEERRTENGERRKDSIPLRSQFSVLSSRLSDSPPFSVPNSQFSVLDRAGRRVRRRTPVYTGSKNAQIGFIRRERALHATEEDRSLSRSPVLLLSRSVPPLTFPCPHAVAPASLFSAAKYTSVLMLELPPEMSHFSPRPKRLSGRQARSTYPSIATISDLDRTFSAIQNRRGKLRPNFPPRISDVFTISRRVIPASIVRFGIQRYKDSRTEYDNHRVTSG
jgi:hypothetical protein